MCERTRRERNKEFRIEKWCRGSERFQRILRPGSLAIGIVVLLYGAEQLVKGSSFPNKHTWSAGEPGGWIFLVTSIVVLLGYFFVTRAYARELKHGEQNTRLQAVCRDLTELIEGHTGIARNQLGAHVWTVAGPPSARYLRRRATFLVAPRSPTTITWLEGKGVMGACWADATNEKREPFVGNLATVEQLGPDESAFCKLPRETRFNMSWREFQNTRHYRAIWVCPLFRGRSGAAKFVGCVSLDVQADGRAEELERVIRENGEAIGRYKEVCESVLG